MVVCLYVPLVISCGDKYLFSSLIITLQNTVVQETLKRLGAQLQAKVLNELNKILCLTKISQSEFHIVISSILVICTMKSGDG